MAAFCVHDDGVVGPIKAEKIFEKLNIYKFVDRTQYGEDIYYRIRLILG